MLETVERGLDEERSRGAEALMAGVDSGELDVRDDEVAGVDHARQIGGFDAVCGLAGEPAQQREARLARVQRRRGWWRER